MSKKWLLQINVCKIYSEIKKPKYIWTKLRNFGICFQHIFEHWYQTFIYERQSIKLYSKLFMLIQFNYTCGEWVSLACCGFTSETCVKTLQSYKILRRRLWLGLWLGQSDLCHCFAMCHMELFFACVELLIFQARSWSKLLVYFLFCSWLLPCRH